MSLISHSSVKDIYKPLDPKAHKGTQGHVLLVGGSYGKIGSICLSAKAALRSGCGLVTAFIPECGYDIFQTAVPEAMVLTDLNPRHITGIRFDLKPQAIGIGPGMGQEPATQKALHHLLKSNKVPTILDADALNILAQNPTWIDFLPEGTIMTPHPKELERLLGKWRNESDRLSKAIDFSKKYKIILVLKGAPTIVVDQNMTIANSTGNAALATAGSGDALTGIIVGLLAQKYAARDAAILGVHLHGLTADIARKEMGAESFVASDIINYLGKAWLQLGGQAG